MIFKTIFTLFKLVFKLILLKVKRLCALLHGALPSRVKKVNGMTFVEILVVLTIIAGIASLGITKYMAQLDKAKVKQAKILITRIAEAFETFYMDCSYYPSTDEGLSALVLAPERCGEAWGPEPYLKNGKIPKDPWKNDFIYRYDTTTGRFEILSLGKGGVEGGKGVSADISSQEI